MKKLTRLLAVLFLLGCSGPPTLDLDAGSQSDAGPRGDILDELRQVSGLVSVDEFTAPQVGYRFFVMFFDQPVDHQNPNGPRFNQLITLLHRDYNAPMVLGTTGYHNYWWDAFMEPTLLLQGNQIVVEHRYFERSRPDPADWNYLRIKQAAADHHRIVLALKPLYRETWVSTGGSKGGMTSIYHRRFFPDDVDATVAYVAPISFGAPDTGYQSFFDTVGTLTCRQDLHAFQRQALMRRTALEAMARDLATANGYTFLYAGGLEAAFESDVAGFEWSFWQVMGEAYCSSIPGPAASDAELFNFLNITGGVSGSSDENTLLFMPYYFQAIVELGYPSYSASYLDDLRLYAGVFGPSYLPDGAALDYDATAMPDIQDWVIADGTRLMLVYGEFDPWGAGAFALGPSPSDNFLYWAPRTSHRAGILDLATVDRDEALATLERWTGVTPVTFAGDAARRLVRAKLPPRLTPPPWRVVR